MLRNSKKKTVEPVPTPGDPSLTAAEPLPVDPADPIDPVAPVCEPMPAPDMPIPSPIENSNTVLERELASAKDRYLRLLADFENSRKRQNRDREETIRRANEALLQALLPVLDHLELALNSPALDRDTAFVKGVQMVAEQFVAVLHKFELKPINALGELFDPSQHEALTQMPATGIPAGHVVQQLRRGWSLSGRLLRPAQVIVSSGAPETAADPNDSSIRPPILPPQ